MFEIVNFDLLNSCCRVVEGVVKFVEYFDEDMIGKFLCGSVVRLKFDWFVCIVRCCDVLFSVSCISVLLGSLCEMLLSMLVDMVVVFGVWICVVV